jgi:hypothetical protein
LIFAGTSAFFVEQGSRWLADGNFHSGLVSCKPQMNYRHSGQVFRTHAGKVSGIRKGVRHVPGRIPESGKAYGTCLEGFRNPGRRTARAWNVSGIREAVRHVPGMFPESGKAYGTCLEGFRNPERRTARAWKVSGIRKGVRHVPGRFPESGKAGGTCLEGFRNPERRAARWSIDFLSNNLYT